mgnify:CR=1 FL=1
MADNPVWMQDPSVSEIAPQKLEFLKNLVEGGQAKSQKEMMLYMMQNMKLAKSKGITFSPSELQLLMETVRKYTSPEELKKVDDLIKKAPH